MLKQRLTRRSIIQRTAVGIGASVLLAACAQTPASPTAPAAAQPAPAQPAAAPPAAVAPTAAATAVATPTAAAPSAASTAAPTQAATPTAATNATSDPKAVIAKLDRSGWPKTFTMGFFGGDDPTQVLENSEPLAQFLSGLLEIEFKAITGTSYSAVIEALRAGHADSMEVGPFSYILAVQEAKAEAIVADVSAPDPKDPKYDPTAKPYYYSLVITKKGHGISSLADLKGKTFSFVDPASTSGHLMPTALLVKNGIDPDKDLKTIYAGSHPTSVLAVWNGKVDAGATYDGNLYNIIHQGQAEGCWFPDNVISKARTPDEIKQVADGCAKDKIIILAQSPAIPNTPFAVRSNLPETLKQGLRVALLDVKNHPELVAKYGQWYVDPSAELGLKTLDAFYDSLRDAAKILNLDLKKLSG